MARVGGRSLSRVLGAVTQPRHYRALAGMALRYPQPARMLARYLLARGGYPLVATVRTPLGRLSPTLYSHHDLLTLNEIFCREDYPASASTRAVVDLGSNIGLSALYFLSRSAQARCYLYEPVPRNVARLRENLAGFEGRYTLHEVAVAAEGGEVEFGVEQTGRYGGIGVQTGESLRVRCRGVNEVLEEVLRAEGQIDIVKIDTEGAEETTLRAIAPEHLRLIRAVYAELPGPTLPPPPDGFHARRDGEILQLFNEAPAAGR